MENTFRIRIETAEKEEITRFLEWVKRSPETEFEIVGSVRSCKKRDNSGYLHYFRIRVKEEEKR